MIEHGMKECSKSSPRKLLSPTLKVRKMDDSFDSEDYLEVHYTDTSKNNNQSEAKVTIQKSKTTPPKQENSKSNERNFVDIHDIFAVTHLESVQSEGQSQSDESILSKSPHTKGEDILQHVEDITHVERVQNKRTSITSAGSANSYVDESLTQEETLMLDNDNECFSWEEDKLLLEIDETLESTAEPTTKVHTSKILTSDSDKCDSSKHNSEDTRANEDPQVEEMEHDGTPRGQRSQSMTHSESGSSIGSAASNISSKAIELKNRLAGSIRNNIMRETQDSSVELDAMRPVTPTTLPADDCGFPLNVFTKVCVKCTTLISP